MTSENQNNLILFAIYFGTFLFFLGIPMWGMFRKTGMTNAQALITMLIPVYNFYYLFKIAGLSGWLVFLFLLLPIPLVGPIIGIFLLSSLALGLANKFNFEVPAKTPVQAFGCAMLLMIFNPFLIYIYAFGSSRYRNY